MAILLEDDGGLSRIIARVSGVGNRIVDALEREMGTQMAILQDTVRDNIAARFNNPTVMQAAVGSNVTRAGSAVFGAVGWGGVLSDPPPYMTIQEVGGTTPPHEIPARYARALAFFDVAGDVFFLPRVNHPGSRMPPHYFLRDAIRARRDAIVEAFRAVTGGVLRDRTAR